MRANPPIESMVDRADLELDGIEAGKGTVHGASEAGTRGVQGFREAAERQRARREDDDRRQSCSRVPNARR